MQDTGDFNILSQIIALKRLGKKGFGERSLFDLLMAAKDDKSSDIISFLSRKKGDYGFVDEEIERLSVISERLLGSEMYFEKCHKRSIGICSVLDGAFPQALIKYRSLPLFFYQGDIEVLRGPNLAIVGTRTPTNYGISVTERIVRSLEGAVNIVSGGAAGIDSVAHSAAIKAGVRTAVVMGTPINKPYPSENAVLFERIVESGGILISAYGPDEESNEYSFPKRNQHIVELSLAVVVVEGGEKSGAEITGDYALARSVPLFAVPGPVTSPVSICPNRLISKGAHILYSEDLLKVFLGIIPDSKKTDSAVSAAEPICELSPDESDIFSLLGGGVPLHIDEIVVRSKRRVEAVSEILLSMELKGVIEQMPGKFYKRRGY